MFFCGLIKKSLLGADCNGAAFQKVRGGAESSLLQCWLFDSNTQKIKRSLPKKWMRSGFTMIELMVVIVIVALLSMSAISTTGIFTPDGTDSARKLAANIKYLFDQAALSNSYIRIYFNFEKNSYEVSASRDRVLLFGKKREVSNGLLEQSEEMKKRQELLEKEAETEQEQQRYFDDQSSSLFDEDEIDPSFLPVLSVSAMKRYQGAKFDPIGGDDELNFKVTLPQGVKIAAVYNDHYEDYVTVGEAELFIFPNGTMQRGIVVFYEVESEEYCSLLINSEDGRSEIVDGYYSLDQEPEEVIYDE